MRQMAQGCGVVGAVTLVLGVVWVGASVALSEEMDTNPGLILLVTFPGVVVVSILVAMYVAARH